MTPGVLTHARPLLAYALAFCGLTGGAHSDEIDWSFIAGGSGVLAGGGYALEGTVTASGAGALTGGGYTLEGGFTASDVASACDTIDFNRDGEFPDTRDIDDFVAVLSGGPCSNDPYCGDIDFNNDGFAPDTADIDALLSMFDGGPCL